MSKTIEQELSRIVIENLLDDKKIEEIRNKIAPKLNAMIEKSALDLYKDYIDERLYDMLWDSDELYQHMRTQALTALGVPSKKKGR